jgi:small subunit ribosomal protein S8
MYQVQLKQVGSYFLSPKLLEKIMSMQDPIADMLTRIRNAQAIGKVEVKMPHSKIKEAIAKVLLDEGYITNYGIEAEGVKRQLVVTLKYYQTNPVIEMVKRISRPGLRVYKSYKELPVVQGGFGTAIVSTPKGVMTALAARAARLGGEVLCIVS